jgi:hypothetical protein
MVFLIIMDTLAVMFCGIAVGTLAAYMVERG